MDDNDREVGLWMRLRGRIAKIAYWTLTHKICTFFIAIKTYPNTRQQIVYIRNGELRRRQVIINSGGFAFAHGSREPHIELSSEGKDYYDRLIANFK